MRRAALLSALLLLTAGCLAPPIDRVLGSVWTPGDVEIHGTVESVARVVSPSGEFQRVGLGSWREGDCAAVLAPPDADIRVGQSYATTLHFEETTFNGQPAVLAPELACPIELFQAIRTVSSAVAWVRSCNLALQSWQDGEAEFMLEAPDGHVVAPGEVRGHLARWEAGGSSRLDTADAWAGVAAGVFVNLTHLTEDLTGASQDAAQDSPFAQVVDLGGFATGAGALVHADVNGNGHVDDFDRIRVALPAEGEGYALYTLWLDPNPPSEAEEDACAGAAYLIVNGPQGPVAWDRPDMQIPAVRVRYDDAQRTSRIAYAPEQTLLWVTPRGSVDGLAPQCGNVVPSVVGPDGTPKPLDGSARVEMGDVVSGCAAGSTFSLVDTVHNSHITEHRFPE